VKDPFGFCWDARNAAAVVRIVSSVRVKKSVSLPVTCMSKQSWDSGRTVGVIGPNSLLVMHHAVALEQSKRGSKQCA
jgi:hypothetical protein